MILGFTGTRNGATAAQKAAFRQIILDRKPETFRQGCCVGADEDATVIVRKEFPSCRIVAHPGKSARGGANEHRSARAVELSDDVLSDDSHFSRNRTMVQSCNELVAMPWQTRDQEPGNEGGGGTWHTIRFAIKVGRRVTIVWPDGEVETR